MKYDPVQLRRLRDQIDDYLAKANEGDQKIYGALEDSISRSVTGAMKPLVDEFGSHVDRLIEANKPSIPAPDAEKTD